MSYAFLWWALTRLDSMLSLIAYTIAAAWVVAIILLLISIARMSIIVDDRDATDKDIHALGRFLSIWIRRIFISLGILYVAQVLIPSKKDAIIMTGLHLGSDVIDEARDIPSDLMSYVKAEIKKLKDEQ